METHINPNKYYSRIFCSLYIKYVDLPNYILLLDRLINNLFCKKMLLIHSCCWEPKGSKIRNVLFYQNKTFLAVLCKVNFIHA